jgi:microcystin-dependent protein
VARHETNAVYTVSGEDFPYADGPKDHIKKEDLQKLGLAVKNHDHADGRGNAAKRLASGAAAGAPAQGHAGEVYVETDTTLLKYDDGNNIQETMNLTAAQRVTGLKTHTKLALTGPAAIATMQFVGIVATDGPPLSGTYSTYDFGFTESGQMWMCSAGGTPGTWFQVGGFTTGDVKTTFRTTADTGWMFLYGQTIDATQTPYLALWDWANGGSLVGSGNLFSGTQGALVCPDLRGTVLAGADTMGGSARNLITALSAVGKATGAATVTLDIASIPAHGHPITDGTGGHVIDDSATVGAPDGVTHAISTGNATLTVGNTGGGGAHANVQPTMAANVAIKL